MPKGQGVKMFLTGVKPNWPRKNSFCLNTGAKTGAKKTIWIFKLNHMKRACKIFTPKGMIKYGRVTYDTFENH